MKEDMLEVLIYLFENYFIGGESFEPSQAELAEELEGAGFTGNEINKAFVWLEELIDTCEQKSPPLEVQHAPTAYRFYTEVESERLKIAGQSLLTRLVESGVLDLQLREMVIDRVMALDTEEVEVDHIKWVALMVLSNQSGFSDIADWAEVAVAEELIPIIH